MTAPNSRCIWPPPDFAKVKSEAEKMEEDAFSLNSRKRKFVECTKIKNPVTYTPLSCLRMLSETGYVFDMEISTMNDEKHQEFYKHRWRCEIWESRDGKIRGKGEGPRKILAKEAAVLDLLDNLKELNPVMEIPKCKVPKGSRISPSIITKLLKLCEQLEIQAPLCKTDLIHVRGRECYETTIAVADGLYKERSYDQFYSKLQATYEAYNHVASNPFKLYDFYCGKQECIEEDDEFVAVEHAQFHVVKSQITADQVAKLQRVSISARTLPGPSLIEIRKHTWERRSRNTHSSMDTDTASTYTDDNPYTIVASSARTSPALSSSSDSSTATIVSQVSKERSALTTYQMKRSLSSEPVVLVSKYGSFRGPPPTKMLRYLPDSPNTDAVPGNSKENPEFRHFQSISDEADKEVEKINAGFGRFR